jgi:predicted alpha/beta-fold hydrolase
MLRAEDYQPPRWLRDPHVQSALSASPLRRQRGLQRFRRLGALTTRHQLEVGDGVRLQGFHSTVPGTQTTDLAVLLHGWEGSADSSYMLHTAATLLERGFEVFRLNFRDHGETHHLNPDIFHSCRLDEVVLAVGEIATRFPSRRLSIAGYSLGGNFALRVARAAPGAGLTIAKAAAVCPVLDPAAGMLALEHAPSIYQWYFLKKWRRSLRRKRDLFPEAHNFDDAALEKDMRELTRWLVERYTPYGSLEGYFDGYCIAGDRLHDLVVPAAILMANDDPVIPVASFHELLLPDSARLEIAAHGGHCGFIEGASLSGFAERWVADALRA